MPCWTNGINKLELNFNNKHSAGIVKATTRTNTPT